MARDPCLLIWGVWQFRYTVCNFPLKQDFECHGRGECKIVSPLGDCGQDDQHCLAQLVPMCVPRNLREWSSLNIHFQKNVINGMISCTGLEFLCFSVSVDWVQQELSERLREQRAWM